MFKYEFKSRTALRPYIRTTIAKRRKFVKFDEAQTISNSDLCVLTWGVLRACKSTTLRHLANFIKGFRFKDPYERFRLRMQLERMPIILNKKTNGWASRSIVPTSAVKHYKPKATFKPTSYSPEKNRFLCSCSRRDGLQYNCKQILITAS